MTGPVRLVLEDGWAFLGVEPGYVVTQADVFRVWAPHVLASLSEGRCPHHYQERVSADQPVAPGAIGGPGWLWCLKCAGAWRPQANTGEPVDYEWQWSPYLAFQGLGPTMVHGSSTVDVELWFRGGPYINLAVLS